VHHSIDFFQVTNLMPVESGLRGVRSQPAYSRLFTESDDIRDCNNKICPPGDEQGTARNMLRIIM